MGFPVYPFALPPDPGRTDRILTELRIHGVSGPDPAGVLESPGVFHVAGDAITGFARRQGGNAYGASDVIDPAAPHRRLEAFSWRGVSSGAGSRSLWLLLTPFAFLNISAWMHPIAPEVVDGLSDEVRKAGLPRRDPWNDPYVVVLHALLRALAVGFTLLLMLSTLAATVDIPYRSNHVICPSSWSSGACGRVYRFGGLTVAALTLLLLHVLGKVTWSRYEASKATTTKETFATPLAAPCFWNSKPSVSAQEWVHVAVALALVVWVGVQPSMRHQGGVSVAILVVGVVAAMGVVAWPRFSMARDLGAATPLDQATADKAMTVGGGGAADPPNAGPSSPFDPMRAAPGWWTWLRTAAAGKVTMAVVEIAVLAGIVVASAAVVHHSESGSHRTVPRPAHDLFRIRPALAVLLVALTALMVAVFVVVALMRRRAPANRNHARMLGGWATALMPPVAFLASAVLTSAVVLAASKVFDHKARHIITPGFAELADVGSSVVLVAVLAAGGFTLAFLLASRMRFNDVIITSRVRHPEDRKAYRKACGTAHVVRSGYRAVPILALGAMVWLVTTAVVLLTQSRPYAANLLLTLFAMAIAALPGLLMTVFRNVGKRRAVGVIWDVTTFWPRAVHPLAPPCYAERVIPQLISRVEALQQRGPVLVSGHSQGAMISSALFQQLPADSVKDAALATYGCQLSFLFARAFPSYCGGFVLDQLATDLEVPAVDGQPTRWLNLFRLTDLLGSTVFLSSTYADINREVADPRYARYIKADEAGADFPRLQLQLTEWPVAGDLITDTKPLGHSDYPASHEYRLAAHQLDMALGHGTPPPVDTLES